MPSPLRPRRLPAGCSRCRVSVDDGLLSIRRGFRDPELRAAFAAAGLAGVTHRAAVPLSPAGGGAPEASSSGDRATRPDRHRGRRRPGRRGHGRLPAPAAATTSCCSTRRASRATRCAAKASRRRPGACSRRSGRPTGSAPCVPTPPRHAARRRPTGRPSGGHYRGRDRAGLRGPTPGLRRAPPGGRPRAGRRGSRGRARDAVSCVDQRPGHGRRSWPARAARETRAGPRWWSVPTAGAASWRRGLGLLREHPRLRRFAVRGHWEGVQGLGDLGEMHVGGGGYCGIAPLSPTLANVTFVLDGARPRRRPAATSRASIAGPSPALASRGRAAGAARLRSSRRVRSARSRSSAARVTAPGAVARGRRRRVLRPLHRRRRDPGPAQRRAGRRGPGPGPRQPAGPARSASVEYERARDAATRDKFRFNRLLQVAVGWPAAANVVARRLAAPARPRRSAREHRRRLRPRAHRVRSPVPLGPPARLSGRAGLR